MAENPYPIPSKRLDVVIIGAGLSGLGAAYRLQTECPDHSYAILEGRASLGGTWDQFKYPGIRSDSPMICFGFGFKPYKPYTHLAEGREILEYMRQVAEENRLDRRILYHRKVTSMSWDSTARVWALDVDVENGARRERVEASFVIACTGYYEYERAGVEELARFPGREDFEAAGGRILHPQFWQAGDLRDKTVVVVGSGATAISIVPSLAKQCRKLVMVQRSPTYIWCWPRSFSLALTLLFAPLHLLLGLAAMQAIHRHSEIWFEIFLHTLCLKLPRMARAIFALAQWAHLGSSFAALRPHLTPKYDPWTQRVCLDADGDFLATLRTGGASIVTCALERFTARGVQLADGSEIECDVVVTATGLKLVQSPGNIEISVDGTPMKLREHVTYRGAMLNDVPNLVHTLGYLNIAWTLRAELMYKWTCRLLNHMRAKGATVAVPRLRPEEVSAPRRRLVEGFTPTYFLRALDGFARQLPSRSAADPWQIHIQDHFKDKVQLAAPLDDGVLHYH